MSAQIQPALLPPSMAMPQMIQGFWISRANCGTVVDVGGGDGSRLAAILRGNPKLQGVLADLPHVADRARQRLEAEGLAQHFDIAGCDFFKAVPAGDTYVLKWIIHDWDDGQATSILKNCRAQMKNGRVLLVEAVLQPGKAASFSKCVDLVMLVMTGGRERTESEYRDLLAAAGLKLARINSTRTEM